MTLDDTLDERGTRYGDFKTQAQIAQHLKEAMRESPNWEQLPSDMKEALENIQHKIARILNGDPTYTDSWHDIQGYARLVEEPLIAKAEGVLPWASNGASAQTSVIKDVK